MVRQDSAWRMALEVGNLPRAVKALTTLIERLDTIGEKGAAVTRFTDAVSKCEWLPTPAAQRLAIACGSRVPGGIRAKLHASLLALPVDDRDALEGESATLLVSAKPKVGGSLLVSADAQPNRQPHSLCGPRGAPRIDVDDAFVLAFEQAARCAVRQAAILMGGGFHSWCAARAVGVTGYLPATSLPLRGGSAGLPFAVAALSSLAQVPVMREDAFSAGIRSDGMLLGVDDLAMKVTAASEAGCTRLFVARSDMDEAPRRSHRPGGLLEIVPCRHFAEVLEHLGVEDFQRGIALRLTPQLSRGPMVMPATKGEWAPSELTSLPHPRGVLLSFVTPHDPHATAGKSDGVMDRASIDGPLLTLVGKLDVDRALLLGVPALHGRDRGLAMVERLARSVERLQGRSPHISVRSHYFSSVGDPFDEWQVANALGAFLDRELQALAEHGAELHVNTSFLPPALHLILERVLARFPELRVIRWRATRDVTHVGRLCLEEVRAAELL